MEGKKVKYTKEESRWSDYEGLVLDKVTDSGTTYYLIQNSHNNEVDRVRCSRITHVIPDKE